MPLDFQDGTLQQFPELRPPPPTLGRPDSVCAAAKELGIDIALDFAINASPDHPWLTEHPDWFHRRPDGTLKYAENPPKKYQDIYNVNWDTPDWRGALGRAAARSSCLGGAAASRCSASTTRTPSRSPSGSG